MNPFAFWLCWSRVWTEWSTLWWKALLDAPVDSSTLTVEERRRLEALRHLHSAEIIERKAHMSGDVRY